MHGAQAPGRRRSASPLLLALVGMSGRGGGDTPAKAAALPCPHERAAEPPAPQNSKNLVASARAPASRRKDVKVSSPHETP